MMQTADRQEEDLLLRWDRPFQPAIGWLWLAVFLLLFGIFQYRKPANLPETAENQFWVEINQASMAELLALPELGPRTSQKIIDYRVQHGPFRTVEQLTQVPGIGPATLKALRPLIYVQPNIQSAPSLVQQ